MALFLPGLGPWGFCPFGIWSGWGDLFDIVNQVLMRSWARPFIAVCLTGKGFW